MMAHLKDLIKENSLKVVENVKNEVPKTSIGRELINNLMYRVQRRGNIMVEMNGHHIEKIRISLSSNFFNNKEKNLTMWVHPYPWTNKYGKTYLMLKVLECSSSIFVGTKIKASDIFGLGINRVKM
jgi:acid phosphatase class B